MTAANPPKGETPTSDQATGVSGEQLSFLPPPPFCPIWPTKNTLADVALRMLMDGRMIDHNDFIDHTRSWRLGAVIFTLRTLRIWAMRDGIEGLRPKRINGLLAWPTSSIKALAGVQA